VREISAVVMSPWNTVPIVHGGVVMVKLSTVMSTDGDRPRVHGYVARIKLSVVRSTDQSGVACRNTRALWLE
jgi:hypothetical protein